MDTNHIRSKSVSIEYPQLCFRLEESIRAGIEKLAKNEDRSQGSVVRQAVKLYLQSKGIEV